MAAHVVEQPPWRGHDDVDAGFEGALLGFHRHAAVDGDARDGRVIREPLHFVVNLRRQFARRRENQRARHAVLRLVAFAVLAQQARENRQQVRRGLARARLGAADDVAAVQRVGQDGTLNGRCLFVSALIERVEQVRILDECGERDGRGSNATDSRVEDGETADIILGLGAGPLEDGPEPPRRRRGGPLGLVSGVKG